VPSGKFNKILIVRTDRIGDVILTTPAIKLLKDFWPDSSISMLVAPQTKELIINNENIDEVIIDDRKGLNKGLFGYLKLVRELCKRKFDLAIVYHTKRRANLTCFLAGIPVRLGYKNKKFGFLLTDPLEDERFLGNKHESQYCVDVLKALDMDFSGIDSEKFEMQVSLSESSEKWAGSFLKSKGLLKKDIIIAIHPGASDSSKQWPYKYFAGLIEELIKRYKCKIVIVGDARIKDISEKIVSLVRGSIIDATGFTTVGQLVSLLNRCGLLVSNDSGPVHIAAALGVPVVSIFTRNEPGINPECWRPLSANSVVVSVPYNAAGQMGINFQKADECDQQYLEIIKIPQVLEAVDSIFKL